MIWFPTLSERAALTTFLRDLLGCKIFTWEVLWEKTFGGFWQTIVASIKFGFGTIQVLRQPRGGRVGGVRKWQFLLIYSTIYADVGGWVGLKKQKKSYVTLEWSLCSQLDAATKLLWLGVIHKLKPETNFFQMYYFLKLFWLKQSIFKSK